MGLEEILRRETRSQPPDDGDAVTDGAGVEDLAFIGGIVADVDEEVYLAGCGNVAGLKRDAQARGGMSCDFAALGEGGCAEEGGSCGC